VALEGDLIITDLHVEIDGKEILKGVNLTIKKGEIHALMGPNGSGKSTLAYALAGHPKYKVTRGSINFKGQDVLVLSPDKRAQLGLFLAFQYPSSVPGVSVANFLRTAVRAKAKAKAGDTSTATNADAAAVSTFAAIASGNAVETGQGVVSRRPQGIAGADIGFNPREFRKTLQEKMALLQMADNFKGRSLNDGFSGGEKKRVEILQMAMLKPEIAILDEPDSGLDIDAIRIVSEGVNDLKGPNLGVLIITHYQRILNYVSPDFVHVMLNGQIVKSGGRELALELEQKGYDYIRAEFGVPTTGSNEFNEPIVVGQ